MNTTKYYLMNKTFCLLLICLVFTKLSIGQSAPIPHPPVMQWGINIDVSNPPNTLQSSADWALNIKQTHDGGYIVCGYSHGFNLRPQAAMYRLDANGKLIWQKVYDPVHVNSDANGTGQLDDVIETSTGNFAAVGYQIKTNYVGIFILTDKDGTQQNSSSYLVPGYDPGTNVLQSNFFSVAEAPDGTFIIGGDSRDYSTGCKNSILIKTDGHSYPPSTDLVHWWSHSTGSPDLASIIEKIEIVGTDPNDFYVVVAGEDEIQQIPVPAVGTALDNGGNPRSEIAIERDVYAAKVHYNGSTFSNAWLNVYANSVFPTTRTFNDFGPYTKGYVQPTSCDSPILDLYLAAAQNNRTWDMIVSKNAARDVIILAANNYYEDNGLFNLNEAGVGDCDRPWLDDGTGANEFDDYREGDGYLMRISYSNGSAGTPVQVAHFSGEDLHARVREDNCNNFIVSGTTADDHLSLASADISSPHKAAPLLGKYDQNFNKIWRRTVLTNGQNQGWDYGVPPIQYDYECCFGLVLNPDNSMVICGNNGENEDDAYMTKVSSDNQANTTWEYNGYVAGSGTSTFPSTSGVHTFRGTLRVPSGSTLTISGCTLEFAETNELYDYDASATTVNGNQSGIVVEKGGKLIVQNSTLRGLQQSFAGSCATRDYMWDGITVEGDPTDNNYLAQAAVELENGTVIEDAKVGVRCNIKTYINHIEQTTASTEQWDHSWQSWDLNDLKGGGRINTYPDVTFRNCRKSVELAPYPYWGNNIFRGTNFVCDGPMVDPSYTDRNGARLGNNTFCSIYDEKVVKFSGCDFEGNANADPSLRGYGIATYDASYTVQDYTTTHCKFNNLYGGIVSGATSNSAHGITIKNAEFGMDHSSTTTGENVQAIYFSGMGIGNTIRNNYIKVPQLSQGALLSFGIQYDGCTSFSCYDNILHGDGSGNDNWGIIVASSGGNDNVIYRNILEDFKHSTTALFNNATSNRSNGLQFKCNEYKNSGAYYGNLEDLSYSLLHPGTFQPGNIRLDQGTCITNQFAPDYYTAPAGNTFTNSCYLASRIFLDIPALSIDYHFNNGDPFPVYDPGSPGACTSPSAYVATQDCGVPNDPDHDPCPEPGITCSNCTTSVMQQMDAQISQMKSLVDGGDTQAMLDFLGFGNATPQEAITELEEPGPYLSDEVLLAAIEHADEIGNSGLKDVIIENSPLSYSVYESLLFLKPVIAGNAAVINAQLAQLSPREALELQIGQLQGEKRQMALQLIEYYLTNDTTPQTDSAAMLLAAAGYRMDAAGMLAFAGNLNDASTLLEGTQPASQEELDEKNMMRISLFLSGENKSISQEQLDLVTDLAKGISPAATQAKNVLHLLNQTDIVPEIPDYYRGISAARLSSPKDRFIITNYFTFDEVLLAVSPNPASSESTVSYQFAASLTKPLVRVSDMNGKQFILKTINQYANSQLLETSNLTPGVYYVQLMDGASLLKSVPLVIIQ